MSHLRLRLCVVIGALLALVGSANAFAAGNLVISQVYGGGGNAGASYTHDFVEIFNRGTVSESSPACRSSTRARPARASSAPPRT